MVIEKKRGKKIPRIFFFVGLFGLISVTLLLGANLLDQIKTCTPKQYIRTINIDSKPVEIISTTKKVKLKLPPELEEEQRIISHVEESADLHSPKRPMRSIAISVKRKETTNPCHWIIGLLLDREGKFVDKPSLSYFC